jgi:hypothetical protein
MIPGSELSARAFRATCSRLSSDPVATFVDPVATLATFVDAVDAFEGFVHRARAHGTGPSTEGTASFGETGKNLTAPAHHTYM